jgi:UDP-N-acetylmuramoyl-tripeptide--D-alanyl-D-alanine ligase
VLNGDDPNVRWMATQSRARVVTFGFGEDNDVRATGVTIDWPRGTRFTLHTANHPARELRIRLLGRPMVAAALGAVAVGLVEGLDPGTIATRLEALPPTPGRTEALALPGGAYLIRDEYKGALETIDAALDLLAEVPAKRRIVVLGDVEEPPGSQGPIYGRVGTRLADVADHVVFLTPQRRRYTAGARRAGRELPYTRVRGGVIAAAEAVGAELEAGDVVLVKGRSTERLDRVSLALAGRRVRCRLETCNVIATRCASCPMLERGWEGLRVVF